MAETSAARNEQLWAMLRETGAKPVPGAEWLSRRSHWPDGLYMAKDDDGGHYEFDEHYGPMDAEMFSHCALAVGRNEMPALLFDMVHSGLLVLSPEATPAVVADSWCSAEYPQRCLDADQWIAFFDAVGYTHDGAAAERPPEPVELFRGCHPDARFGMAWTTVLDIAHRFAYGALRGRKTGQIYTATVQPRHLLAYFGGDEYRDESEFVVNPAGLSDDNVRLWLG